MNSAEALGVDLDRDRIFDDLERALTRSGPTDSLPVIVTVHGLAPADAIGRIRAAAGRFEIAHQFSIIDAFSASMTEEQIRIAGALPFVAQVELNGRVKAFNDGARRAFGVAAARLDAPGLDGDGDGDPSAYSSRDLVAAVIDTGIDAAHRDLDEGKVLAFKDFVNDRAAPYDDHSHGTHVAATLAGEGDARPDRLYQGVAPGAALVGVKVLGAGGSGFTDDVIAGIDWVVANKATYGIEAMNLSLGVPGCWDGESAVSAAIDSASDAGVVPVVAAGNSGPGACSVGDPAAAAKALTVGNMYDTAEGGFRLRASSSRGPTRDGRIKPDVAAPGSEITSAAANTADGYSTKSGTSMAAPFVAGVALLVLEANPALRPGEVKQIIMDTAIDWGRGAGGAPGPLPGVGIHTDFASFVADPGGRAEGPPGSVGPDIDYGAGQLDAYRALQAAHAPIDSPPQPHLHEVLEGELKFAEDVDRFTVEVPDARSPLAMTLIVAEGGIHQNGRAPSISSSGYFPGPPEVTVRDPTGAEVPIDETTGRQVTVSDTSVLPGTYTVEVRAPVGQLPEQIGMPLRYFIDVSYSNAVEPPDTTITAGPGGKINETTARFEFSSSSADASFGCALDSDSFESCVSPKSYADLAEGSHTFAVRARDGAGSIGAAVSLTWTIDLTPPGMPTITDKPAHPTTSTSASFSFTPAEPGGTLECKLDLDPFSACSSPKSYTGLTEGQHRFSVRQTDAAGNTGEGASFAWVVAPADATRAPPPPASAPPPRPFRERTPAPAQKEPGPPPLPTAPETRAPASEKTPAPPGVEQHTVRTAPEIAIRRLEIARGGLVTVKGRVAPGASGLVRVIAERIERIRTCRGMASRRSKTKRRKARRRRACARKRRSGSKGMRRKRVRATSRLAPVRDGRFTARVRLRHPGTYRIRVRYSGDRSHGPRTVRHKETIRATKAKLRRAARRKRAKHRSSR